MIKESYLKIKIKQIYNVLFYSFLIIMFVAFMVVVTLYSMWLQKKIIKDAIVESQIEAKK